MTEQQKDLNIHFSEEDTEMAQEADEKIFNITNHLINASQSHSDIATKENKMEVPLFISLKSRTTVIQQSQF